MTSPVQIQPALAQLRLGWGFDCRGAVITASPPLQAVRPAAIWPYDTGVDGVDWPIANITPFQDRGARVYRVNQGTGAFSTDPFHGDEFDLEAGAWTIDQIAAIVAARRAREWSTRVYSTWANYGALKQKLAEAGTGKSVWFRIADWNLSAHLADAELHADVYAGQYASPTSNPAAVIPGTDLTLAQVSVDLNVILLTYTGWQG